MALSPKDPSSFSRPELCEVKHLHLELDVNFQKHTLSGKAWLDLEKKSDTVKTVLLDTRALTVHRVTDSDGKDLAYTQGYVVDAFGQSLEITLPESSANNTNVTIEYETSSEATALQWLEPAQTAGKKHPYLFSQCQAIHARSMVPCQDSPGVKMTYSAKISAPADLVVLMSAVRQGTEKLDTDSSKRVHSFMQKVPIPSYLIAIVAGALQSRDIGPRSKVWSEKESVAAAAYEFAETEDFIKTAEDLLGPYVWGVYDLLVLPPSFPYGGMENPCLTFVTPTLLAGDRSLADVVAHEISHSWTGNLVTNANWEHFWLNEGHTKFVERKIVARLRGGEKLRDFLSNEGWRILQNTVQEVLGAEHPYTHLVPKLEAVDPDDAFSTVPYEKGSNLLMYLEQLLGGPAVFEPFLKAYIERFKYKSITTDDWKAFLYEFFNDKKETLDTVDWDTWFFKPGMPPVKPKYDTSLADACVALAQRWSSAGDAALTTFSKNDLKNMTSPQVREFLSQLLEEEPLSAQKIARMEEVYGFNAVKNSEIRFRWIRLCLRARISSAIDLAIGMATEQGRMKFTRPLFRDMFHWQESRGKATVYFHKAKPQMHSITATMVGKDLDKAIEGK